MTEKLQTIIKFVRQRRSDYAKMLTQEIDYLDKEIADYEALKIEHEALKIRCEYLAWLDLKRIKQEFENNPLGRPMTDDEHEKYKQSMIILHEC